MKKNILIYGKHPALCALKNPNRKISGIFITKDFFQKNEKLIPNKFYKLIKYLNNKDLSNLLSNNLNSLNDINHQSIIIKTEPIYNKYEDLDFNRPIVLLDQLTDPHNIGAIIRSAAAFNFSGVITTKNNCPEENSTIIKSSCGAYENTPLIRVTNLARTIDNLKQKGYWCIGLDVNTNTNLNNLTINDNKIALILGSEGKGLRKLTQKNCDQLVKLPISDKVESLNVSNAAAIAFYHITKEM